MLDLARLFSPHQLNPFDINPLRKIISEHIDFEALRSPRAIRLFIAATRLSTGTLKLFENAAFLREMRNLALAKREIDKQWLPLGALARKLKRLNFHLIETDDLIGKMRVEKSLNADLDFLLKLKDEGRERAETWLEQSAALLGRRSSIDLAAFVYAVTGTDLVFSMPCVSMNLTISSRPCPVFRLLNRKGLSPRILRVSRSITSSDAPT